MPISCMGSWRLERTQTRKGWCQGRSFIGLGINSHFLAEHSGRLGVRNLVVRPDVYLKTCCVTGRRRTSNSPWGRRQSSLGCLVHASNLGRLNNSKLLRIGRIQGRSRGFFDIYDRSDVLFFLSIVMECWLEHHGPCTHTRSHLYHVLPLVSLPCLLQCPHPFNIPIPT